MYFTKKKYRKRSSSVPWFRQKQKIGMVYLLVSMDDPKLFKIGFTERLTNTRRNELERASGHRLRICHRISMPHAYACEQRLHKIYRRKIFGKARDLGTEWYRMHRWESVGRIRKKMNWIAWVTKVEARFKLSWPKGREIRAYGQQRSH